MRDVRIALLITEIAHLGRALPSVLVGRDCREKSLKVYSWNCPAKVNLLLDITWLLYFFLSFIVFPLFAVLLFFLIPFVLHFVFFSLFLSFCLYLFYLFLPLCFCLSLIIFAVLLPVSAPPLSIFQFCFVLMFLISFLFFIFFGIILLLLLCCYW